ncbi:hypothetical protein C8J56DRAFT_377661 [Mycena floridula]|nr:hypothetical protein C8J56DRAFT_377661 [Mycena floridula]
MLARRALLQFRPLRANISSTASRLTQDHTTDSYSKDVDSSEPLDSKIHRVDGSSENVQKPHEPPSGRWSQAGVETNDYAEKSTGKSQPDAQGTGATSTGS